MLTFIFFLALIFLLYLFALNGRYIYDDGDIIDKWTLETYFVDNVGKVIKN